MLSKVFVLSQTKLWLECMFIFAQFYSRKYWNLYTDWNCRIVTYPLDKVIRPFSNRGASTEKGTEKLHWSEIESGFGEPRLTPATPAQYPMQLLYTALSYDFTPIQNGIRNHDTGIY